MSNIQGTWSNSTPNQRCHSQHQQLKQEEQPINNSNLESFNLNLNTSYQIQGCGENPEYDQNQDVVFQYENTFEQPLYYTFEEENSELEINQPNPSDQISQYKSSSEQKKQIQPDDNNEISIHHKLDESGYDKFKICLDQDQISSQFSSTQSPIKNEFRIMDFKIVIPQFNLKQYVKKNNINEDLVQCSYFQSSVYTSEDGSSNFNQFSSYVVSEQDDQVNSLEVTILSSSSSSLPSQPQKKEISSSSLQIVPVVNLLDDNSKDKKQRNTFSIESKKDKKKKKKLQKLKPEKETRKNEKFIRSEKDKVKFTSSQSLPNTSFITENKQVKQVEKPKKKSFPPTIFENIIQRQRKNEQIKKQEAEFNMLGQKNQIQIERRSPSPSEQRRTGKKQSKKQKKQKFQAKYKSQQISNSFVKKPDDISEILKQFKRSHKLQQLMTNHHQQKAQLLNCVLFNNFIFQNLSTKIPQASKIPQSFSTIEAHQRAFQSNIKNELYYQIRQKIKQIGENKETVSMEEENNRGISLLFTITIKKQSKVQIDGLCEISAIVQWPKQDVKMGKIMGELMQNYRSRYRLFMFIDEHKLNVLCQIRDMQKTRYPEGEIGSHNSISLKLVAGVDLRQSQKNQKINQSVKDDDRYYDNFQQFSAKFYDLEKITTTIRQYQAILNLKYSPLAEEIINPATPPKNSLISHKSVIVKQLYEIMEKNYNPSQMKAINEISSQSQGIQLLQGPPGTGKTSTLLGLLSCQYAKLAYYNEELFKIWKTQKQRRSLKKQCLSDVQDAKLMKILICAPSNSAVDLISNKIFQNGLYSIPEKEDNQIWLGQKRYKLHKVTTLSSQITENKDISIKKQSKSNKPIFYRKYPQILRIGISTKQTEGIGVQETNLSDFDLYHIINAIFLKQLKGTRKEISKQQVLEKINILSAQIKEILSTIQNIIEKDKGYGLTQDISVNKMLNNLELKKKIVEALTSIVTTSGQVLKKMKFSANAFYIKDVIKFIEITIISQAEILLTTLTTSYSQKILTANPTFTCLIVDQAAQATEPSVLIPLQFGVRKVILIGDQCQLPPTVKNPDLIKNQYNRSLFQRIWQCRTKANAQHQKNQQEQKNLGPILPTNSTIPHPDHKQHMLDTQYRMNAKLREFPSIYFYNQRLKDAEIISLRKQKTARLYVNQVNFIDCASKQQKCGNSYINMVEGQCVVAILAHIMKIQLQRFVEQKNQDACLNIGVITPYNEQQKFIKSLLNSKKYQVINSVPRKDSQNSNLGGNKLSNLPNVTVSTVDSYQGQQRDIIIISTVRSNSQGNVGFLQDERRINVALTRAKFVIIVVGNSLTLKNSKAWNSYIEWVKTNANYLKCNEIKQNDFSPLLQTLFRDPPQTKTRRSGTKQKNRAGEVMQEESDSS